MKSRDVMLGSLVVGLIVLWLAISPTPTGAASLVGGWVFVPWCTPCYDAGPELCSAHAGCSGGYASVCYVGGSGAIRCLPLIGGGYPCTNGDGMHPECENGRDTDCR